jgi:biopolymer transport protein TolR
MKRRHRHLAPVQPSAIRNEINVTPLVDVVLVLLIIFMVVTPMLSRGVEVELPGTLHHDKKQDTGEQIVVSISQDGRTWIGTENADGDKVISILRRELGAKSREVHVKADRRLEYGQVRTVLERLHTAGAGKVALGTDEIKEGK